MIMKRLWFAIALVLVTAIGSSYNRAVRSSTSDIHTSFSAQPATEVTAARITNRSAPFIDGVLEDVWRNAGKLAFPNAAGGRFTTSPNYDRVNPSTFTVYFLHDDINLYIAVETTNDSMVESSD